VTALVEQKLQSKELEKYRLYIDELDKVLYLLLRLSDRLAKAENAIWALPQNASDKEKASAIWFLIQCDFFHRNLKINTLLNEVTNFKVLKKFFYINTTLYSVM